MSGFLGRWPEGFVPEEHGWKRVQVTKEGPDPFPTWKRWEIPFRHPAVISQCLHDERTGAVGGWYMGPIKGLFPEEASRKEVHAELLRTDLSWEEEGDRCGE